jgi:hypothetical protein
MGMVHLFHLYCLPLSLISQLLVVPSAKRMRTEDPTDYEAIVADPDPSMYMR